MNQDADQLRDAFVAHEYLAPDAAEVIAVVHERARRYRRRRRAAQSAGGAVLGAGLVAGSVAAPGWLNSSGRHSGSAISLAAPAPRLNPTPTASSSPSASPAPVESPSPLTSAQQDQALTAYFNAGYDYNDALALAQLWHMSGDPTTIKAEAGRRLLAGQKLPFTPSPAAVASGAEMADLNAYFAAGYTYEDAVGLAQLWKITDPYQAKVDAGGKLLAGVALPIAPGSQPTPTATASPTPDVSVSATDLDAYFAAGYGYDEALQLAQLWHMTGDPATVKAEAGRRLLAGQTLPIRPSAPSPTPTGSVPVNGTDAAVAAYFAAGYTYDDALTLGKMWNIADTYQVKADAGQKLLAGQTLPIKP
jgi:hypothetical protein